MYSPGTKLDYGANLKITLTLWLNRDINRLYAGYIRGFLKYHTYQLVYLELSHHFSDLGSQSYPSYAGGWGCHRQSELGLADLLPGLGIRLSPTECTLQPTLSSENLR